MADFKPIPNRRSFKNLAGQRIRDQITVLGYLGKKMHGKRSVAYWLCECDCGNVWETTHGRLVHSIQSCGCFRFHGMCQSDAYSCWLGMKQRCYNHNNEFFSSYGGRGIVVCDEWVDDFPRFCNDMGPRPTPKHSIDRIDNDGPYAPWNCRWATATQQASNKTNSRLFEIDGVTKTLAQWSREFGVGFVTVHQRLLSGWSVNDAFKKPTQKRRKLKIPPGVNIPKHVIYDRLRKGWTFERAISKQWLPRPRKVSGQP